MNKGQKEWEKIKPRVESMFLKTKEQAQKCSIFGSIDIRMPQYRPQYNEIFIHQNLDRIFRHPDEYRTRGEKAVNSPKFRKYETLVWKMQEFINKKMSKHNITTEIYAE